MAELAIWIVSFVAVGWLSILCAYAIGMILLLPVTGVAWVVENIFPRVRLLLQPVGDVASRFRPATRAAVSVLPRSRAAIAIFVFVVSCGAYWALRPLLHPAGSDHPSISFDDLIPSKQAHAANVRIYDPATGAWAVPIQISAPDGSISIFPDGMSVEDMGAVLAKDYPDIPVGLVIKGITSPWTMFQRGGAASPPGPGDPYAAFSSPVYPAPAGGQAAFPALPRPVKPSEPQ